MVRRKDVRLGRRGWATICNVARVILICGLPGSGKTALARALARERRGVRLCPDEWLTVLEIDLYDEHARDLIETLQWRLAEELLQLGQSVVIEWGLWGRSERDALRHRCRELGVGVELRFLDVPVETLWQRVAARNADQPWGAAPIAKDDLLKWAAEFEAPDAEELAQFDSPEP